SSVMVPFGVPSLADQRKLAYDDIAGISEIYAGPVPPTGVIRGLVRSPGGTVLGAHVVAVNQDGTPVVSTLSQPDGTYVLRLLPPGAYKIYAEPLDLPVSPSNLASWYAGSKTDFGTTYLGSGTSFADATPIEVTAGSSVAVADIAVLQKNPTGLNI